MSSDSNERYKQQDWLYEQYVVEGRSTPDIAEEFDVTSGAVHYYLDKYDIKTRDRECAMTDGDNEMLRDADWLRQKYEEEGLSTVKIGDKLNVSPSTVRRWLSEHGIESRDSPQEASDADFEKLNNPFYLHERYHSDKKTLQEIADELNTYMTTVLDRFAEFGIETNDSGGHKSFDDDKISDRNFLKQEYVNKERTVEDIADECGCSNWVVLNRLRKNDIEVRSKGTQRGTRLKNVSRSATDGEIGKLMDEDWLRQRYKNDGKSTTEIAEDLGLNQVTVFQYLQRHGIESRDRVESLPRGSDHYKYKDVDTGYYGPNWDEKKLQRRIVDQCRCQVCGMTDSEHTDEFGRVNSVHHIQPRSRFIDSNGDLDYKQANRLENLITLCSKHHPDYEMVPIDNRN